MDFKPNNSPIGVFDSGLGGLTVWQELRRGLPGESLVYFGDGKNCPYGDKSRQEVTGYVDDAVGQLVERFSIKMLVVACNAATAMSIDLLRQKYDFPIVGMEPAVKPAALSSKSGVVAILATSATLGGRLFRDTAARYADRVEVLSAVGEGFVELVEANIENTPQAVETVRSVLEPMLVKGADKIVLGCTHYPFLIDAMREVIGDREVEIIDPSPAVERRVAYLLEQNKLFAAQGHLPFYEFMTAADDTYLETLRMKSEKNNSFRKK